MKSIVVLPTYNEAGNLERLLRRIRASVPDIDMLVIDDSSPDGTGEIADRLASQDGRIRVVHRPAKSGRGSATIAGFRYAIDNGYDYVFEMDVDLSHSPEEMPKMIEAAKKADLVIASRFVDGGCVEGWNWARKLIHFMADLSVRVILGTPNTDHTNGFRCYRVERLANVDFNRLSGFGYIGQTILENLFYRLGYKIDEVPSVFKKRDAGLSKMGKGEMLNGLKVMSRFRWNRMKYGLEYYIKS